MEELLHTIKVLTYLQTLALFIKLRKVQLSNIKSGEEVSSKITLNFDKERMNGGKVILIINDISKDVKYFLINMKVQSKSKSEIISICNQFVDVEDRMKVVRIIYDEFRKKYVSKILHITTHQKYGNFSTNTNCNSGQFRSRQYFI